MAKFSKKVMGKEVGDAKVYAKPHNMKGMTINALEASRNHLVDPNTLSADSTAAQGPAKRVSAGNPAANNIKTSGIAQRGHGAATKGFISRGPMG
jgi:hypothetical protein